MLATSDQAVLKRDPQLPGLALLLDTKRMLDVLQLIYPQQHIQGLTSTYLKYKPQTNCLVGFLADTSSGPMRITAIRPSPPMRRSFAARWMLSTRPASPLAQPFL